MNSVVSAERLRDLLHYDPETGDFTWKISTTNRIRDGAVAGCIAPRGYRNVRIDGRYYLAHRLAWLYMTGEWPAGEIDHCDRDPSNNVFANLREATRSQNMANTRIHKTNKSGFKGVVWNKAAAKWQARIGIGKKKIHLGVFDTPEEAYAAYSAAADKHFGAYARVA